MATALETLQTTKAYWQTVINTANTAIAAIDAALIAVPNDAEVQVILNQIMNGAAQIATAKGVVTPLTPSPPV